MRILVVGGGGREHALAWKLSQEAEVICAPGNPGIAEDVECVPVKQTDAEGLIELCRNRLVDLVVVGPEDPLIDGLAVRLRGAGIVTYGPNSDGAQLEGSKAFSKEIMRQAGVPTAIFETFTNPVSAKQYAERRFGDGRPQVVKASGNAVGKGVVVADHLEEAKEAIDRMMVAKEFGEAGSTIVLEDRLPGPEFSVLTIIGDQNVVSLPVAQDHKRVHDGDQGPNTGGMGTYSPVEWVSPELVQLVEETVVHPAIETLRRRGIAFRGTLFSGLMMDGSLARCLEYNVRFGDPETQSVMLRLGSGLAAALYSAAVGERIEAPAVLTNASVCVVVASEGYPIQPRKGLPIEIGPMPAGAKLFHAGTGKRDGQLITNGGRVFGASASAPTFDEAREIAYTAGRSIKFDGAFFRNDIGDQARLASR
jgi:phosphoribosylamine--glycine ligase